MPQITVLLGLCGSGKSYLARKLQETTGAAAFDGVAGNESVREAFLSHLKAGKNAIVEDVTYCNEPARTELVCLLSQMIPDLKWNWICFEADLDSANWNVRNRPEKNGRVEIDRHIAYNNHIMLHYTMPAGARIEPIHRIPARKPR